MTRQSSQCSPVLTAVAVRRQGGYGAAPARAGFFVTAALLAVALAGCGPKSDTTPSAGGEEPKRIVVQHVLIAFEGSAPGKNVTRTQEEARLLADDLLQRAKAGENFDELVDKYSDDDYPGVYELVNTGEPDDPDRQVYARQKMVPAFGDVAFSLEVGQIGLATYDAETCKFGWHVIKRLK